MKNNWILVALLVAVTGCNSQGQPSRTDLANRKIQVVTTTGMITDAVQRVGGERLEVTGLMGAGIDPHGYEATAGDVGRMDKADVIFYNGLHLEGKMGEVFEQMGSKGVAVTSSIDRSRLVKVAEFEGGYDPHVWFDVDLWKGAVEKVRDTLVAMDPKSAELYKANAGKYLGELDQLHKEVLAKAKELPAQSRKLVTAHDAFNYFGRAYGFEVQGLQGVSTEAEASVADVQKLASFIIENKVPTIFVETSVNQKNMKSVKEAVAGKGFTVRVSNKDEQLFSDALGDPGTPEGTYVGMVRHNIGTIVRALTPAQ